MSSTVRVSFDDLDVAEDQSMTWQGEPFSGIAYETDSTSKLVSEVEFAKGLQNGMAREWYASGQLRSESEYANGSRHGHSKTWHQNGCPASVARYQYSIKLEEKTWREDGLLIADWSLPKDDKQHELLILLAKRFPATNEHH